jgi:adenylate cyclase, class 2
MNEAPIEYEVKFFPVDLDNLRTQLKEAGASLKHPERLMRRCLFSAEANLGMSCTYVRVRDESNKVTMSAKLHPTDGQIASQKEYETIVDSFEAAQSILLAAGLKQTGFQENKRETWQMSDGTLIELETWPELPNYIEIEGNSEEAVKDAADLLGFDWDEHIVQSNDYLYSLHHNIDRETALKRFSELHFEN